MKRFLNLKFSVFSHINFRAFVLIIVALWVVIPLKGVAQATMSELTKKVDFSSEVKMVSQKYDYWCYYACLESITNDLQCFYCFDFIHRYLMDGQSNPYPKKNVSDEEFRNAIEMLKDNSNATCTFSSVYANLGVSGGNFGDYLTTNGFQVSSALDFIKKISQQGDNPSITFFLEINSDAAHCVAFVGSQLYNNNWNDPKSIIYIMDPGFDRIRECSLNDVNAYSAVYCK